MTSLQKAKAFFESRGKKLALAVAPLAMIAAAAVPAHAIVVATPFPIGPGGSVGVIGGGDIDRLQPGRGQERLQIVQARRPE